MSTGVRGYPAARAPVLMMGGPSVRPTGTAGAWHEGGFLVVPPCTDSSAAFEPRHLLHLQFHTTLADSYGLVLQQPEGMNLVLAGTAARDFIQHVLQPFPIARYFLLARRKASKLSVPLLHLPMFLICSYCGSAPESSPSVAVVRPSLRSDPAR